MLLVALAAVALYLPTLGYDFAYDSVTQVQIDDFIHQPRHFADLLTLRVLGMDALDFNRPVNLFTLMVDSLLWGKNPAGYRLTNLLLHGAVVALLFRWLRMMTGNFPAALGAALLFAVHPLHCETVVEVGYREDLLATFFLLAGLNAAAAFEPGSRGKCCGPAILVVACLFLSAASKETGIAGPALLLVFWLLFRRRKPTDQRGWAVLVAIAIATTGTFFALRFALEPKPSLIFNNPPPAIAPPGIEWLLAQSRIWSGEFLNIVWPSHLCADYGSYNLRSIDPALALIGILFLIMAQIALAFWSRKAAFACAIFWAALLPVSNLIPIYRPMADRYLYMPMMGVALLAALALASIQSRHVRRWSRMAVLAGVGGLTVATLRQQTVWKDTISLWKDTSLQNPFSINGWMGQGYACLEYNQPAQALQFFEHAVTLTHGQMAEPFAGIALAADALGQSGQAAEALTRASKLDSRYAKPDTLLRALVYPAYQAQHFTLIAQRNHLAL